MKDNNNITRFNSIVSKIFLWTFFAILILNILGIFYQGKRSSDFMESHPDGRSNMGIFIALYMMVEIYILFLLLWTWSISQTKGWQKAKLTQLIILFIIGILPGIFLAIGSFLKK